MAREQWRRIALTGRPRRTWWRFTPTRLIHLSMVIGGAALLGGFLTSMSPPDGSTFTIHGGPVRLDSSASARGWIAADGGFGARGSLENMETYLWQWQSDE